MRTTINLDDDIFRAFRQRAAARGTTFAREVEEALRADLHARRAADEQPPFELVVFEGDGSPALVDVNDHAALEQLADDEDRAAGRW